MIRSHFLQTACLLIAFSHPVRAQIAAAPSSGSAKVVGSDLRYVVYLSRHGVRSPTGKTEQYHRYSVAPWPSWPVPPGYLTPHGFQLMEYFGAYDREQLAGEGLLSANGCADAAHITIYADSDERTRETGKALAKGLMPGCEPPVLALPEGTNDPLFHPKANGPNRPDAALATAAINGRIGGDPNNLTLAYRSELTALDQILAACGTAAPTVDLSARESLLDIPATLSEGVGDHLAELKGPLATASTLSENLLLEYAEGMEDAKVGWGCVHHGEVARFMALHTAAVDFSQRTPEIALAQASNLMNHIRLSLQQAASQKPVHGALGHPTDRALFLVGHDTNQENVGGLLNLTWIIDGRRDDTPPGGALIFELWRNRKDGRYSVRAYFTAQTLEEMRSSTPLTISTPPARVELFIPGCSEVDMSCTLDAFSRLVDQASGRSRLGSAK